MKKHKQLEPFDPEKIEQNLPDIDIPRFSYDHLQLQMLYRINSLLEEILEELKSS